MHQTHGFVSRARKILEAEEWEIEEAYRRYLQFGKME